MQRREILRSAGMLGAMLPLVSPSAVLAQASDQALLAHVHPEFRHYVGPMLQMLAKMPPLTHETLPRIRAGSRSFARKPLAGVPFERRVVPGQAGEPDVPVFVVNAGKEGLRPAILHCHGGGFVMGSAENAVAELQGLCRQLDCVAVSVDYRLAPETTFAGSVADTYAGLKWLHANAAALGVDPARIAVMGESAGGGHAALLALVARNRGEVPLAFQCLTYPMLDDRTGTSRQMPAHVGMIGWTARQNRFGWESFLGARPGGRSAPRGAVPARVADLRGLPPAWIGVGSIDLFCDEDVDYAQRLNAAGVPAQLIVGPGGFHGFDAVPGARISQWFNEARLDALRAGLGITRA